MARIKDSSVRDVVAAADMVEVVSGRTQFRRASGSRYTGRCPFHEEKTPSLLGQPGREALLLLRLREGGRRHLVRPRDGEPRLRRCRRVARRAVPRPIEVEEAVAARRGRAQAEGAAVRGARPDCGLLRAAALGRRRGRAGARVPRGARARGGGREGVPTRARARQGARGQGQGARLHARRAQVSGTRHDARNRLLPAAPDVPARGRARPCRRLPGPQARARTIRCAGST